MTKPAELDLYIFPGATLNGDVETWTWAIDGDAVNLTGYTATLVAAEAFGETPRLSLTSAGGGLVLGGSAGTIVPVLSAAASAQLWADFGDALSQASVYAGRPAYLLGPWNLELTSGGGIVTRLLQGKCYLVPEA